MRTLRIVSIIFLLTSCAALDSATSKDRIGGQSFARTAIFISPIAKHKAHVFLDIKNSSGKEIDSFEDKIRSSIEKRGYNIVDDPAAANLVMQVNVRMFTNLNTNELYDIIDGGYSMKNIEGNVELEKIDHKNEKILSALDKTIEDPSGLLAGFAIGAAQSNPITSAITFGVIGSIGSVALWNLSETTYMTAIADVRVLERVGSDVWYYNKGYMKEGDLSYKRTEFSEKSNMKTHATEVISFEPKGFNDAHNEVIKHLVHSVSNLI